MSRVVSIWHFLVTKQPHGEKIPPYNEFFHNLNNYGITGYLDKEHRIEKQRKMSLLSRYGRSSMTRYMLAKLAESQNSGELQREQVFKV